VARTHAPKVWASLKAAYRRGEGTYAELGKKFGVPEQTIRKRAAREKWTVQRNKVAAQAERKAIERDVESVAAMLGKHRGLANLSLHLVELRLAKLAERAATDPESVGAETLDNLTKVVSRMVTVERLAAGIERIKPVMPVEMADDAEIVFEIDAPPDDEETAPGAPAKAS
jgi:hypothetical protein